MWPISSKFKQEIQKPVHRMRVLLQVLDNDGNVVDGGEFHDTGCACTGEMSTHDNLVDGSVDLDIGRGARRTMNVTLINKDGEFSPRSKAAGFFFLNRRVRLWRGVVLGRGEWEVVPIGTFFIDTADVVAERNMSLVVLSGTDYWKMLNKAKFGAPKKYEKGTHINEVIKDMAERCGVDSFVMDALSDRTSAEKTLQKDLNYERGDVIGDELLKLGTDFALEIYFDPLGRLTTDDLRNPEREPSVWEYKPGENSLLLSVKATWTDDKLYNHVIVTGTADENNPVYGNAFDNDPDSMTNIETLGRRTREYESALIGTADQAKSAAKKVLLKSLDLGENIELQAICNPALEGNDVIEIEELDFTKVGLNRRRYRIKTLTIPLSSSRQQINVARTINLDTL